jgi:c-di-GMP-binding flagellar brake protein YcgR
LKDPYGKNIDERRKYIRVKSNFNVKIDIDAKKIRHFFSNVGKSIDISGSGVLFRYNKLVELGTIIKLTFLMPNSFDFFEGKAKVVRTEINPDNKTYDIGIVFIDLNEDDKGTLNYYVTKEEGF